MRGVLSLAALGPAIALAQSVPNVAFQAPITITQGGTYAGNYRSADSNVPCITVATTQPVVIENCVLAGAGDLIKVESGASVTVRNNRGYSLTQSLDNIVHGKFLGMIDGKSLVLEHNYLEHTTGIILYRWTGDGSPQQTVTVRYNKVREIDGRFRNGGSYPFPNFIQLNQVRGTANIDISFNEVINTPNQCATGDVINFYNASGTAQSPMALHDNYVQGAYPYPANIGGYSGTGMTTDGDGTTAATITAFLNAYNNQFVATCNAAMNIAAGHDIHYYNNRMVTSAYLPDGSAMASAYAATAVFNGNGSPGTVFYNNRIDGNTIGYRNPGYNVPFADRHDESYGSCATCANNTHLPNPITLQTEANEFTLWQQKVAQNGLVMGPVTGTPPPAGAANVPPVVRLVAPATGTAGVALALTATASDADGAVAKVEFFSGAAKLGEDLTAPYGLSFTPAAAGALSLSARATDNAGAATASAPVAVAVAPAAAAPAPVPAGAAGVFYRALNLGGPALRLDGHAWEAGAGAPGFATNAPAWASPGAGLSPAPEAGRAAMLTTAVFGTGPTLALAVPNGAYSVFLYVWEDNNPETIDVLVEGRVVRAGYSTGPAGHWERLGPFAAAVADGTLNVATAGGNANLSGLEIYQGTAPAGVRPSLAAPVLAPATSAASLYPNPVLASTQLLLPVASAEDVEVGIYTAQGTPVGRQQVRVEPNTPSLPLATTALPAGTYTLRVLSGSQRGKIIRFAKE